MRDELLSLGADAARETVAGCYFFGSAQTAWRVCLWSRLANRVLYPLSQESITSADDLYAAVAAIDWTRHWSGRGSLAVDFTGRSDQIRHTQFGAQKVKDAMVDQYRDRTGQRPEVDRKSPDLLVNARLHKDKVSVSIDFSGHSLHRRGYRIRGGAAPLKENLAAAILLRADWPGIAARGGALLDPLCGSGTLVLEGALMAADIAPGLMTERFGFESWTGFDNSQWRELREEADARARLGKRRVRNQIIGTDYDPRIIEAARENAARAGCADLIRFDQCELSKVQWPVDQKTQGLMVTNPPYGERLGEQQQLEPLYEQLGEMLRSELNGWSAAVFTSNRDLARHVRLVSKKKYALFNGKIPAQLMLYDIPADALAHSRVKVRDDRPAVKLEPEENWSEGARMFANRLRKNRRRIGKWARRGGHECYRLYDADMPEYAVAIDCYADHIHVAEYQAPSGVSEEDALRRLKDIQSVIPVVLEVDSGRIHHKRRQRQRGSSQYQRHGSSGVSSPTITVKEGDARFLVNLDDYLDTGLFLDHRPLRRRLRAEADGLKLLNLFCYTASITVQAILGGAGSSVSVDLSPKYIEWARRNFELNAVDPARHELVRADCIQWLQTHKEKYDLIVLDPPSFSNSKRTSTTLDLQRDHAGLVESCMDCLESFGTLFFSTNRKGFRLDADIKSRYTLVNLTAESLDEDFKRRPSIHQLWSIQHR